MKPIVHLHIWLAMLLIIPSVTTLTSCQRTARTTIAPPPILIGTWQLQEAVDTYKDGRQHQHPDSGVTITFARDGALTQFFDVGAVTYRGRFTVLDANHLEIEILQDAVNKGGPPYTQEFRVTTDMLVLTTYWPSPNNELAKTENIYKPLDDAP